MQRCVIGDTIGFTATAIGKDGDTLSNDTTVTWGLNGDSIGSLSRDKGEHTELITVDMGEAYVLVKFHSVEDTKIESTHVCVRTSWVLVSMNPSDTVQIRRGDTAHFTAATTDHEGNPMEDATISWSMVGDEIGTIEPDTGATVSLTVSDTGWAYVIAEFDKAADSCLVFALPAIYGVHVQPGDSILLTTEPSQVFVATGVDEFGAGVDLDSVLWSLRGNTIGHLSPESGDTTYLAPSDTGSAYVVASWHLLSDSTHVTIRPKLASLSISPFGETTIEVGDTARFSVSGLDQFDNQMIPEGIRWSLEGDAIGDIAPDTGSTAVLSATDTGTAYLVAASGTVSDSVVVRGKLSIARIIVSPDSGEVEVGQSQEFSVEGRNPLGLPVNLETASWSLRNSEIGQIDPVNGTTSEFSAEAVGSSFLVASYDTFMDSAFVRVLTASPFPVVTDTAIAGFIGVFQGGGDNIVINFDSSTACEGIWSLRAVYSVRSNGWAGWFCEEGTVGGHETRDMCHITAGGHLKFCAKAEPAVRLEIGIRTDNISPGTEKSKLMIDVDTVWREFSISFADFLALESRLDYSKAEVYIVASIVGPKIGGAASGTYWIDDVHWTKE